MAHSKLLTTLFQYKSWANKELFNVMKRLDANVNQDERHIAIRILNHIYVVDNIFAANLQKSKHSYTSTNTVETQRWKISALLSKKLIIGISGMLPN